MKWLIRSGLALVVLVAVLGALLFLIPAERIARLAADRFEAATGRALTVEGPVEATLWPHLGVRAEGIAVANAPWSEAEPMLTAGSLEVGIAPGALFGGDIHIRTLEVTGARLVLERRADGTANWQMAEAAGGAGESGAGEADGGAGNGGAEADGGPGVLVDRAIMTGAEIQWTDAVTGTDLHLRAVDVATRLDGLDAPVAVTASALLEGQALSLEASAEALRPLLDGALTPVALSLTAGRTTVGLEGRADLDPASFEGEMRLESGDRLDLLSIVGAAPLDLPEGLGAEHIDVTADVTLAPAGTLHLRDVVATLDGNRLSGAVDIDRSGVRPQLTGTLVAEALDLTGIDRTGESGDGESGEGAAGGQGWSREPLDVSALFAADADWTVSTGPITLDDATIDELHARVTVEEGRAVVALQPLRAYGGAVTGEVVVNARGGLSTRAALELSGLQMQPLLADFAEFDRLLGQADFSVDLLAAGQTVQALADSLDGTASIRLGQGELLGLDIAGMIRSRDLAYRGEGRSTVFDGMAASFAVADGVARSDDLTLEAPYLTISGAGEIALGARMLDYRLVPSLRTQEDGQALSVPILIEGPWADPRIRLDLDSLARARLAEEAAEVRDQAEAEARTRLAEELEVDPDALDSREAIEEAIADRVGEKLLDLLGNR